MNTRIDTIYYMRNYLVLLTCPFSTSFFVLAAADDAYDYEKQQDNDYDCNDPNSTDLVRILAVITTRINTDVLLSIT